MGPNFIRIIGFNPPYKAEKYGTITNNNPRFNKLPEQVLSCPKRPVQPVTLPAIRLRTLPNFLEPERVNPFNFLPKLID
jgi:hypothetical protein